MQSEKQELYVQALQGDKILGHAVTTMLIQQNNNENLGARLDTGSLTKVISSTVSNNFLAQQADQILLPSWNALSLENLSEWEIGTLVEVAISAVYRIDPAAVENLATFLLDIHTRTAESNTKSRLLELGGTVSAERTGGTDHNPIFTATATLDAKITTAEGPNKKRAEMLAAAQLLLNDEYYESFAVTPWELPEKEQRFSYQTWKPFAIPQTEVELKGKETVEEWWIRGAFAQPKKSIHRAMIAPGIFPDVIEAVNCWVWRFNEQGEAAAFAMIVGPNGQCHTVPGVRAVSANQARKIVGLEANRIIAKLVGLDISDDAVE